MFRQAKPPLLRSIDKAIDRCGEIVSETGSAVDRDRATSLRRTLASQRAQLVQFDDFPADISFHMETARPVQMDTSFERDALAVDAVEAARWISDIDSIDQFAASVSRLVRSL